MQGLSKSQVVVAVLLIVAAVGLLLLHLAATSFTCAGDTSYCARTQEKTGVWEGSLWTLDGRPFRSSEFEVDFESRRNEPPVPFHTDEQGRFCIRWASEPVYPFVRATTGEALSSDPKLDVPGLRDWRDLEGREPPPGCQESGEGIPWNRVEDANTTWQYRLLVLLPLIAAALLALALLSRGRSYAPRLLALGGLVLAANLLAGALLWL